MNVQGKVRLLRGAAIVFAVAALVHNADHLRRGGDSVGIDVFAVGTLGMALEAVVVMLVLMNHRLAPLVSASVGGSLAAGYLLVHLLPPRTWLSDSLFGGDDITSFSWLAVLGLVVASVALAVAGWSVLQARGGLASSDQRAQPSGPVLHPVTAALILGNLAVLAGSVATR